MTTYTKVLGGRNKPITFTEVKGDSLDWQFTVRDNYGTLVDLSNYTIRAEIYDNANDPIKVNTNDGSGSISRVDLTDAENGIFSIIIGKNLTTDFSRKSFLEIEVQDANGKLTTVAQDNISFLTEEITWTDPDA